jgi:hypothetical protein
MSSAFQLSIARQFAFMQHAAAGLAFDNCSLLLSSTLGRSSFRTTFSGALMSTAISERATNTVAKWYFAASSFHNRMANLFKFRRPTSARDVHNLAAGWTITDVAFLATVMSTWQWLKAYF